MFSAPTAYLVLESPTFGLALLITLCLTELVNGIVKLYSVRPRPLWVSSTLKRKGNAWEKVRRKSRYLRRTKVLLGLFVPIISCANSRDGLCFLALRGPE